MRRIFFSDIYITHLKAIHIYLWTQHGVLEVFNIYIYIYTYIYMCVSVCVVLTFINIGTRTMVGGPGVTAIKPFILIPGAISTAAGTAMTSVRI